MTVHASILRGLAPTTLPSRRLERFDGSGFSLPLSAFSEAERVALRAIYEAVSGVHQASLGPHPDLGMVRDRMANLDTDALSAAVAALAASATDPAIARAIHDIRGGGLSLLLGTSTLIHEGLEDEAWIRTCAGAARDHAKMMRSFVPELDPGRHAMDEASKIHRTDGVRAALEGLRVSHCGREITLAVHCEYDGPISARCLEIAALDRVAYNLVNNAMRFSSRDRVELSIFLVNEGLTRWVVRNEMTPEQAGWLEQIGGGDLERLFLGGLTRGGSGIGMSNCGEVVAACFGLESPADAVRGKYLGAKAVGLEFYAWFHWPTLAVAR